MTEWCKRFWIESASRRGKQDFHVVQSIVPTEGRFREPVIRCGQVANRAGKLQRRKAATSGLPNAAPTFRRVFKLFDDPASRLLDYGMKRIMSFIVTTAATLVTMEPGQAQTAVANSNGVPFTKAPSALTNFPPAYTGAGTNWYPPNQFPPGYIPPPGYEQSAPSAIPPAVPPNSAPADPHPTEIPLNRVPLNPLPAEQVPPNTIPADRLPPNTLPAGQVPLNTVPARPHQPLNGVPPAAIPPNQAPRNNVPPSQRLPGQTIPNDPVFPSTVPTRPTTTTTPNTPGTPARPTAPSSAPTPVRR